MGQIIRFQNNLVQNDTPKTFLTNVVSATGTTLSIQNPSAFETSWGIQIGGTGEEKAEIKLLGTAIPSGTALNLTAGVSYDHPSDTPIYAIKYDKIKVYRSTSGTSGTATIMTGGTINITPDHPFTQFDDTGGLSTYAYRASFINSVLGVSSETSQSDWFTPGGFSFYSLAKMRDRSKNKLFDSSFLKNDSQLDEWVNEWLETMTNEAIDVNRDYLIGTVDVAHGTNGLATISSSDFKEIRKVWYTTNGTDFFTGIRMDSIDFDPREIFNVTSPFYYFQGDRVIGKKPDGEAGTARITYYKRPSMLVNDSDELPESMWSYTKSFVDYTRAQAAYFDGKTEDGDRFIASAERGKDLFKKQIAPRHKSGPQYIDMVSPIEGEDGNYVLAASP